MRCFFLLPIQGYMSAYGYMRKMDDDDFNTDKISAKKMKKSIKMMQKFMGLKETGELDEMTMMMMEKPRCGVADMTPPSTKGNTTRSNYTGGPLDFSHFGQRWDKLDITFRYESIYFGITHLYTTMYVSTVYSVFFLNHRHITRWDSSTRPLQFKSSVIPTRPPRLPGS